MADTTFGNAMFTFFQFRRSVACKNAVATLFVSAFAIASVLGFASGTNANARDTAEEKDVYEYASGVIDEGYKVLQEKKLSHQQKVNKIAQIIYDSSNVEVVSRAAIGKIWKNLSDEQRKEYTETFEKLLLNKCKAVAESIMGTQRSDLEIDKNVIRAGKKDYNVSMSLRQSKDVTIHVIFRFRKDTDSNTFKIVNMTMENIDMAMSLRSLFAEGYSQNGFEGLIAAEKIYGGMSAEQQLAASKMAVSKK